MNTTMRSTPFRIQRWSCAIAPSKYTDISSHPKLPPPRPAVPHLEGQSGNDRLGVHQVLVAQVVQAAVSKDLGTSLEPDGLTKRDPRVLGQELRRHAAQSAQHGPAGVDELQLAVALERLWVRGQAGSVPAVVARELASQVGRDITLREGACGKRDRDTKKNHIDIDADQMRTRHVMIPQIITNDS
ncbi:hypothetical protein Vretimale_2021 [Volvox reticuliferus]|uniref:Uncharacterized protein n=1 Tax=Volvox reticuliferus TaxID=1737510 RepID=A0A8J4C2M0_9CHLO|nr:hypothetical protein Vretifemale_4334 [Volvox reticuliferus]GIL96144.1 hypothetical protein Vretimale_2021 [Volvox reticuliferus]